MRTSRFYNPRIGWCCVVALVIAPCFWPIYRYTINDLNELVDSPRVTVNPYSLGYITAREAHLSHADSTVLVQFERRRWEKEARNELSHRVDHPVGENSIISAKGIQFRRHNLIVTIRWRRGPDGREFNETDEREMNDLAKSIDAKIQNLEGTRLSLDTYGNKAFLELIKPVLEDAGDMYDEIERKLEELEREFKRARKRV